MRTGLFRAHPLEALLHQSAGIAGEMAVNFVVLFPAAQPDFSALMTIT
jgi:hypothetical protein